MFYLKPKQMKAVQLLAAGRTGREVAKEVGVRPETVSRWRNDADFQAYYNILMQDSTTAAQAQLQAQSVDATRCLGELIRGAESESVKLKASMAVLDYLQQIGISPWGASYGSTNPAEIRGKQWEEEERMEAARQAYVQDIIAKYGPLPKLSD